MLSIAATRAAPTPTATVTLLYGNRRTDTVMFAEELADLKNRYGPRLAARARALPRAPRRRALLRPARRRPAARGCSPRSSPVGGRRPRLAVRAARDDRRRARGARPSSACPPTACTSSCSTSTSRRPSCTALEAVAEGDASEVTDRPRRPHHAPRRCRATTAILDGAAADPLRPAVRLQGRGLRHLPGPGHRAARSTCAATTRSRTTRSRRGFVLTCQTLPVSDEVTVDYDA